MEAVTDSEREGATAPALDVRSEDLNFWCEEGARGDLNQNDDVLAAANAANASRITNERTEKTVAGRGCHLKTVRIFRETCRLFALSGEAGDGHGVRATVGVTVQTDPRRILKYSNTQDTR